MKTIQVINRIHAAFSRQLIAAIRDLGITGVKNQTQGIPRGLLALVIPWCMGQPLKADFFGDFQYTDHGGGITIDRYLGSGGESGTVNIPASIIGKPVTHLGNFCFRWSYKVTGVLIPESVTSIGDYAFEGCHYLTGITIPGSVTSIGEGAFSDCDGLTGMTIPGSVDGIADLTFRFCTQLASVTISSGVTSIGEGAFENCTALTGVVIPDSVTLIATSAFTQCRSLTSITVDGANPLFSSAGGVLFDKAQSKLIQFPAGISGEYAIPDGVTHIGESAFSFCEGLTSVTMPGTMVAIGDHAFSWCGGLTGMSIPASVANIGVAPFAYCRGLASIEVDVANPAFTSEDGVLFNQTKTLLVQCPAGAIGDYVIPDGLTQIGESAFAGCGWPWQDANLPTGLTSVTIPDSVTSIGISAFSDCNRLTSIVIPAGVTAIEDFTFQECSSLSSVTLRDGLTRIGRAAFSGCGQVWDPEQPGGMTAIAIPGTVTSIGDWAFSRCNRLASIAIPAGVTRIEDYTFSYCTALESVNLPHGLTSIGEGAFSCGDGWGNPAGPASVEIPGTVTSIGDSAFSGCNRLTSVTIPNGVISIGNSSFDGCRSLESVVIADSVTSLGSQAFARCTSLANVTLSSGLTRIEDRLFYECTALGNVIIPHGVTGIGDSVFACGNEGMPGWGGTPAGPTGIAIPDTVASIGSTAFAGCNRLSEVIMPTGIVSIGHAAFRGCWSLTEVGISATTTSLGDAVFSGCSSLLSISVDAANPVYSSSGGALFDKSQTLLIQCPAGMIGDFSIPYGVTRIANDAFFECGKLTHVSIPESVTSIGYQAFWGCRGLTYIVIPSGVAVIEHSTFMECSGLASVIIPPGVGSIGMQAFWGCSGLTGIHMPATVTSIGGSAFERCSSLMSITVDDANANYSSLHGVLFNRIRTSLIRVPCGMIGTCTIPAGILSIEARAFADCVGLTGVTINSQVTSIGYDAFAGCIGLTHVTIPASVATIGNSAFQDCSNLASAVFAGNAPAMGWGVFGGTAAEFTVYYFNGRTGFTSPTWMDHASVAIDPAPVVVTGPAYGITAGSATLQGSVNPSGGVTIAQFEYGLTSAYGQVATAALWPNNGTSEVPVSATVNGLQPGQTYHFLLTATNPSGTSYGEDMTFATHPVLTVVAVHGAVFPAGGPYAPGTIADLAATPSPGYVFDGWSGDAGGSDNPLSVPMDANKTIIANFIPDLSDSDVDGLSNHDEIVTYGTDPTLADTDGDGFNDGFETNNGFNPTLATSTPEGIAALRMLHGSTPPAVEFLFNAAMGVSYRIEASTGLSGWDVLETPIIGKGNAIIRFYSTENHPQRFFRATRN